MSQEKMFFEQKSLLLFLLNVTFHLNAAPSDSSSSRNESVLHFYSIRNCKKIKRGVKESKNINKCNFSLH